jgi:hypothetical protein
MLNLGEVLTEDIIQVNQLRVRCVGHSMIADKNNIDDVGEITDG